jgi:prophage regulatory protein
MVQQSILRLPLVIERTGLSRSSIYAAMQNGDFPAHISLGARAVGWLSDDIDKWIQSRITRNPVQKIEILHR